MSEQGDKNLITDVSFGEGGSKESEGVQQGAGVLVSLPDWSLRGRVRPFGGRVGIRVLRSWYLGAARRQSSAAFPLCFFCPFRGCPG